MEGKGEPSANFTARGQGGQIIRFRAIEAELWKAFADDPSRFRERALELSSWPTDWAAPVLLGFLVELTEPSDSPRRFGSVVVRYWFPFPKRSNGFGPADAMAQAAIEALEACYARSPEGLWIERLALGNFDGRQLERILELWGNRFVVAAVLAAHPDGRVRESAVRYLAAREDGLALPILLVRSTDWATEVHRIARASIPDAISNASEADLLAGIRVAKRYSERERWSEKEARRLARAALHRIPTPTLIRRLSGAEQAWLEPYVDLSDARNYAWAIGASNAVVRLRTFKSQLNGEESVSLDLLEKMRRDPAPNIRQLAIETARKDLPRLLPVVEACLLDRNYMVRRAAQLAVRETVDLRDYYERRFDRPAAILGLADIGVREAIPKIRERLADPTPAVRRAAIDALQFLDDRGSIDLLKGLLFDSSPSVVRMAMRALEHLGATLDPKTVWTLLSDPERSLGIHRTAIYGLRLISRADGLIILLRGMAREDLQPVVLKPLWIWAHWARSRIATISPSPQKFREMEVAYNEVRANLSDELRQELDEAFTRLRSKVCP